MSYWEEILLCLFIDTLMLSCTVLLLFLMWKEMRERNRLLKKRRPW